MENKENDDNKSARARLHGKYTTVLILAFIAVALLLQWSYSYYVNNPFKFPWGTKVYTVSTGDLNLLPNEQLNYLGTRANQDDTTDFLYHTNNMNLTAAAAFSIRTGPGVYYQSIGRMFYGRPVHVLATCDDNDWYLIDFYGEPAYVHSACLFEKLPEIVEHDNGGFTPNVTRTSLIELIEETEETVETAEPSEEPSETTVPEQTQEVTVETNEVQPTSTPSPTPTPEPTEAPAISYPTDPTMLELFNLVNNARAEQGLDPLSWSNALASDAAARAQEIAVSFGHTRPDGSEWWTLDPDLMYGENLASGQSTAQEVFNCWWASPGHKANILGDFNTCGFALYYGGDAGSTYYWVQEFGY